MNMVKSDKSNDAAYISTEINRLKQEHMDLKQQLSGFEGTRYLTSSQQLERRELQKRKLYVKDRIHTLSRHVE